jgi:cytidyltransferase-like protein
MKSIVLTFGKFDPLTWGHEKVINKVQEITKEREIPGIVFCSSTYSLKRNTFNWEDKLYMMHQMFPKIRISYSKQFSVSLFESLYFLSLLEWKDVTLVVGSDRVEKYEKEVRKYINHPDPGKALYFDKFTVLSAGSRDNSVSSSMLKEFALGDDFESFKGCLPSTTTNKLATTIFEKIKNKA